MEPGAGLRRFLAPLQERVRGMIARGIVRLVDDAHRLQELQVETLKGHVSDRVERFQQYGLTSVPLPGAEAVVLAVGGAREHLVALAVDDRAHRPQGLAAGEVALYTHQGQRVHLKADGSILLSAGASSIAISNSGIVITAPDLQFVRAT